MLHGVHFSKILVVLDIGYCTKLPFWASLVTDSLQIVNVKVLPPILSSKVVEIV